MNKIFKNENGFGAVEILLVILIIAIVSFGGYYVWNTQHKSSTQNTRAVATKDAASKSAQSTSPYAGWKSYELKYEKLSFRYPATWKADDTSSSGIDTVSFQSSDNFSFNIADGASSGGDSILLDSNNPLNVKFDGSKAYIVFDHGIAGNPDNSISGPITGANLLTDPTNYLSYPSDKNVVNAYNSNYDASGSQLTVSMNYSDFKSKQQTIHQALVDKEFLNSQLVIDSMHY